MDEAARRVAVLGEALVDRFPDADVIGGAPFNVARNLALLGAAPLMITRIGTDALGHAIAADFARFGLDARGLQHDPAHATGTVAVHLHGTQHTFEIGADSAWDHLDAAQAVQAVRAHAPEVIYFGTLAQRGAVSRDAIRAALAASDALPFLDLNLRDGPDNRMLAEESLALAEHVKVNDDELDRLIGWFVHPGRPALRWGEPALRAAIETLFERFSLKRLTITRGGDGWACLDGKQGWLEGAVAPVAVRDTVGAGDAFASVLLLGALRAW
ncbi:MAG: fructokinase, partial [Rhizobiales bacterium]|nr:fructokinase [Rhizobacter sp.]